MVLLKKISIYDRPVALEYKRLLPWAISAVRGKHDGVGIEVLGAHVTTQGVFTPPGDLFTERGVASVAIGKSGASVGRCLRC
jgi:hypothetical protein